MFISSKSVALLLIVPKTTTTVKYVKVLDSKQKTDQAGVLVTVIEKRFDGDFITFYYVGLLKKRHLRHRAANTSLSLSMSTKDTQNVYNRCRRYL